MMFCLIVVVNLLSYSLSASIEDQKPIQGLDSLENKDNRDSWYSCPEGWILNSDSSKCFRAFNTSQSWPESRDFCREFSGDLASINSEADLVLVKTLISEDTWIGLNDIETEGDYVWSDSSEVIFTSWAPGEPNNENGSENCADLSESVNFEFTMDVCSDKKRFICEKTKEEELPIYRCSESWIMNSDSNKCFKVIDIPHPWQDSLNLCREFGGELASLHSNYDFVLAKSMVSVDTWIGLNDIDTEGVMAWSDSSAIDFTSWGPGQPDNTNNSQNCVDLYSSLNFDFDDDSCDIEKSFLCQKQPDVVFRCPNGWVPNDDLTKCYNAIYYHLSWTSSVNLCAEFGGELASIHSEADFSIAKSLLSEDTWIGLNDRESEGHFVWNDGSAVDFTSWGNGEPNSSGNEDCVDLRRALEYNFNDGECDMGAHFLCQTFVN